ncbi:hypothetical protein RDWZM_009269 [Blomia tropicalis]|uniref:Cyclic nucleotide-binding domain-containing protein n=1 Tax=Blomia tropicalis TaxID=40697 RepID=A0A9Q0M514_BLOTA|nr:hypothetical protein RDWZM_009269 [Blomia tropicalis]
MADQPLLKEDEECNDASEEVEMLFQDVIDDNGDQDCHHVNVGLNKVNANLSSLNYDEFNDDTLLYASEWNLATEEIFDDEDVLVISTPDNIPDTVQEANPIVQQTKFPDTMAPMISSEDDETNVNSSIMDTQTEETINQSLITGLLDEDETKSDSEREKKVLVDEAEASRLYLTINSAPLYRWSEGMLPTLATKQRSILQHQDHVINHEDDYGSADDDEHEHSSNKTGDDQQSSESSDQDEKKMYLDSVKNGPSFPAINSQVSPSLRLTATVTNSLKSPWIVERLKHLTKAYNDRTTFVKKAIEDLSDSSSTDSSDEDGDPSVRKEHFTFESIFGDELENIDRCKEALTKKIEKQRQRIQPEHGRLYRIWIQFIILVIYVWHSLVSVFEPQSITYVCWLAILAFAFSYNAIIILFRAVFPYELASGTNTFFIMDTIFDVIYVLDIVWFKCHLKYIQDGQWIDDVTMIRKHYLHSKRLSYDIFAIVPFDLIVWAILGGYNVKPAFQRLSRLNRLLKIDSLGEFFARIDAITTKFPYLFRIIHTLWYMVYIIHIGACSYYLCSAYEGFGSTPWTYDNEGNAYLRCFYFAFRTSASIGGRLPKPNNLLERIYMTIIWLLGVFVFAMVIGQIRDIVANAARDQNYYREILNKTSNHMRALNVKQRLQKRVRFWLNFTWDLQKTFNEDEILKVLPLKSRTDISLSVHYQTLARVELFKNIDRSVLRDLVLKLRPILFLPGDYVCKKGDVGHEMYIVSKGKIVVLAVDGTELISLGEGCVFGEIAILNLEGFTRRTADVRSVGYSQLFALRKIDLWETLKNYPEYQTVLKRKVQRILRKKRQQQNKDKSQNGKVKKRHKSRLRSRQQTIVDQLKEEPVEMESNLQPQQQQQQETNNLEIPVQIQIPSVKIASVDDEMKDGDGYEVDYDYDVDDDDDDDDGVFGVSSECIVKERPRTPRLFDTVMGAVRRDSKVISYFSRSQSISSSYQPNFDDNEHDKSNIEANPEFRINIENNDNNNNN